MNKEAKVMCVNTWGEAERENRIIEKLLGEIKM